MQQLSEEVRPREDCGGESTPDNQGDKATRSSLARVTPFSRSTARTSNNCPGRGFIASSVIISTVMPPNPLANWEKVGDSFYRKIAVYDAIFEDDVELENYIVAGAPYGGAIGKSP